MRAILQVGYDEEIARAVTAAETVPIPEPDPTKSEVRIRVTHAATNPIDIRFLRGDLAALLPQKLPSPVGRDFCGVVDLIPPGAKAATPFAVGDVVCGWLDPPYLHQGAMAEYLVVPATYLAAVPPGVSPLDAVALPLVGNTVYAAFIQTFKLTPGCGKNVLILGGSSATGLLAIQLAKLYGCGTIACTSSNEELCRGLGATHVVNHRDPTAALWWQQLNGFEFDFIFDTVGGQEAYDRAAAVAHPQRTTLFYSIVGDITSGKLTISKLLGALCGAACRGCCCGAGPKYKMAGPLSPLAEDGLTFWLGLVAEGKIRVVRDPRGPFKFTLHDAIAMLEAQASHRAKGKLVMVL